MSEINWIDRLDLFIRAIFEHLKSVGGTARPKDVIAAIAPKLKLTDHEKERTSTGAIRWATQVRFYTTDCVRAGYLLKADGHWTLTPEGEKALQLPPGQLIRTAKQAYRDWRQGQNGGSAAEVPAETEEKAERLAAYEEAKETARAEIEAHVNNMPPYDFQNFVAELLKGMGYYVPFVAPPGPDGGVDILAYKDPLGTTAPRIKVQVKHRDQKVTVSEVRELEGLLRKDGDIGLMVSSGGFTSEAVREIRSSGKHIETMDLDRVLALWQEHYDRIGQTGALLLPLVKVFFLAPADE